jgi:glycosyltransferase involved in cell wall biosynthesis
MKTKTLHVIPFYNIYPAENGGMKRCLNIAIQLAKHSNLTILCPLDEGKIAIIKLNYPELKMVDFIQISQDNFPKVLKLLNESTATRILDRWLYKNPFKKAQSDFSKFYYSLKNLLAEESFDLIVIESLKLTSFCAKLKKMTKSKIIYDAWNFDTELYQDLLKKSKINKREFLSIRKQELKLSKNVDAIWTCSQRDQDNFKKIFNINSLKLVPNGVDFGVLANQGIANNSQKRILFCGSLDYYPNEEGLIWFIDNCWSNLVISIPEVELWIIGSGKVSDKLMDKLISTNIKNFGRVASVKKYYEEVQIVIVPLLSGSGTRLKVLEAMSYGVPIVSTSKGSEGINYIKGSDIVIGDLSTEFTENIILLLENTEQRLLLSKNARKVIQNEYDWDKIGNKIFEDVRN